MYALSRSMRSATLTILLAFTLAAGACSGGCSLFTRAPANLTTAAGRHAYYADQMVTTIGHLQQAVIDAQGQGFNTAQARVLVTFSVAALETIKQSPNGWLPTVQLAWMKVKQDLPAVTGYQVIEGWAAAVDVALQAAAQGWGEL